MPRVLGGGNRRQQNDQIDLRPAYRYKMERDGCVTSKPASRRGDSFCTGQSTAEYIIIAIITAILIIAVVRTFGRSIACSFTDASGKVRHVSDRNGRSGCVTQLSEAPSDDDEKPPIPSHFSGLTGGSPADNDNKPPIHHYFSGPIGAADEDNKPPQNSHFSAATVSTIAPDEAATTTIPQSSTCFLNYLKADCHWTKNETSGTENCTLGIVYTEALACRPKFPLSSNTRKVYQQFCESIGDQAGCQSNKPQSYSDPVDSGICTGLCG